MFNLLFLSNYFFTVLFNFPYIKKADYLSLLYRVLFIPILFFNGFSSILPWVIFARVFIVVDAQLTLYVDSLFKNLGLYLILFAFFIKLQT